MKKNIELLSPAGNMEKLEIAFKYGANAVYLGGQIFTMRAKGTNFSKEELKIAVKYAHNLGKKVYVTVNTIPFNEELKLLEEYVVFLDKIKVDGVIVADFGVFNIVKELTNLNISISTQASNTNWRSIKAWYEMGAKRVVLARELSIKNIKEIKEKVPEIEIEVFIHGAMCMSYSGRCLLSNYLTGRDANRGACAQACRWKYHLVEEKRPGEYFPIIEDEAGTYIFDSKDICTIEIFDQLLNAGVDSLKIEGRMKGINYVAITTKIYNEALKNYLNGNYQYNPKWLEELKTVSHRHYIPGFLLGKPGCDSHNYSESSYVQTHKLVAKVIEKDNNNYVLAVRNQLKLGEIVEVIKLHGENIIFKIDNMIDSKTNEHINVANPNSFIKITSEINLELLDLIRREEKITKQII